MFGRLICFFGVTGSGSFDDSGITGSGRSGLLRVVICTDGSPSSCNGENLAVQQTGRCRSKLLMRALVSGVYHRHCSLKCLFSSLAPLQTIIYSQKYTHVSRRKSKCVFRKCDLPDRFGSCEHCDMKFYNFHRLVYTCVTLNFSVAKHEEQHVLFWFQKASDNGRLHSNLL